MIAAKLRDVALDAEATGALDAHAVYRAFSYRTLPCHLMRVAGKKTAAFPGNSWDVAAAANPQAAILEGFTDVAILCCNIAVLDFDQRDGEELANVERRMQMAVDCWELEGAVIERSGRGYHVFTRLPAGDWTKTAFAAPHLVNEVIAGRNVTFVSPSWHPVYERRYERLTDLTPVMDLPFCPRELLQKAAPARHIEADPEAESASAALFRVASLYRRALGDGKHAVHCPWEHEHNSGGDGTDTVVLSAGGFRCMHSACSGRTMRDVRRELKARGIAAPAPPVCPPGAGLGGSDRCGNGVVRPRHRVRRPGSRDWWR